MRILVDGIVYSSAPSGGIYNYFNEILPRLTRMPDTEVCVFLPKHSQTPANASGAVVARNRLPGASWFPDGALKRRLIDIKRRLEGQLLKSRLQGPGRSVFHSTGFTLSPWPDVPSVATIYDMISELPSADYDLPHIVRMREDKRRAVEHAVRLIAISECTKRDMCRIYGLPAERVDVIHFGVDYELFSRVTTQEERRRAREKYGLDGDFLLYVGGRLHHKNFTTFAEAYATSPLRDDYLLAVVGSPWESHELDLLRRLNIEQRVRWVPYLKHPELHVLYQMAAQFVFPSLYEGFGLPLIEAFASGCPVSASNAGPFPELAAGAAVLFDPKDPADIARKMGELLEPSRSRDYARRGQERARAFCWDEAARLHRLTYERAVDDFHRHGEIPEPSIAMRGIK